MNCFDHLVDVKTLGAGQTYHSNLFTFGNVVETHQSKMNSHCYSSARRLDTKLHSTQKRTRTVHHHPLFGDGDRVLGPVFGAFGEASSGPGSLRDLCAHALEAQRGGNALHAVSRFVVLDRLRGYAGSQGGGGHYRTNEAQGSHAGQERNQQQILTPLLFLI